MTSLRKLFLFLALGCAGVALATDYTLPTATTLVPQVEDSDYVLARRHAVAAAKGAPGATIVTGQASLTTSASVVAAANAARRNILVRNLDATISIYVGATGVTSSTGFLVKAGESLQVNTSAAIYAVAASGTPSVAFLSEND